MHVSLMLKKQERPSQPRSLSTWLTTPICFLHWNIDLFQIHLGHLEGVHRAPASPGRTSWPRSIVQILPQALGRNRCYARNFKRSRRDNQSWWTGDSQLMSSKKPVSCGQSPNRWRNTILCVRNPQGFCLVRSLHSRI